MAHYFVKARPPADLAALRQRIDSGEIEGMRPFGQEMHQCLLEARLTPDGWAVWEETCYCSPPLKQERAVLDQHFTDLTTEIITQGAGWARITDLPTLWE